MIGPELSVPPWVRNSVPDSRVTLEPTFQTPLACAPYTGTPFSTVGTPNRHACAAYAFVVAPFANV